MRQAFAFFLTGTKRQPAFRFDDKRWAMLERMLVAKRDASENGWTLFSWSHKDDSTRTLTIGSPEGNPSLYQMRTVLRLFTKNNIVSSAEAEQTIKDYNDCFSKDMK